MKRDMDLCRTILLDMEKAKESSFSRSHRLPGRAVKEVEYHLKLLADAGLIEIVRTGTVNRRLVNARREGSYIRMTWNGHEFLDAARSDERWAKAKDIAEKSSAWTFELFKDILVRLGVEAAGRAMGLPPANS